MNLLSYITWDMDPEIFPALFGNLPIHPRWYGILFALAFLLGFRIVEKIFIKENESLKWLDSAFLALLIGTIVGARLGHVFFYGWHYYSQHLNEIIKIWQGGLASHGAIIGAVIALWIWSKRVSKRPIIWILDRVIIATALGGSLVRLGNFFNSEIVGIQTNLPWAVDFIHLRDGIARHPAQLYESIAYMIVFIILYRGYWKYHFEKYPGLLLGIFMTLVFGFRFCIEFIKENQETFENGMALNMGQWLSLPMIGFGIYLIRRVVVLQNKKSVL